MEEERNLGTDRNPQARPGVHRKQRKLVQYVSPKQPGSQLQSMKKQDEDWDGEMPPFHKWIRAQDSEGFGR